MSHAPIQCQQYKCQSLIILSNSIELDMTNIILDPMCMLGISTYHQKNLPSGLGASIGSLYAIQRQLTYKISLSSPLGTNRQSPKEIIARLLEYESMKSKKAKNNINYYDQYVLIGWYFMGNKETYFDTEKQKYSEISNVFAERSAPYCLFINTKGEASLFKEGQKVKYSAQMETLQKYCSDTMYFQSSKEESALEKSLKKQQALINIYNEKLKKLRIILKDCDQQKKREIKQLLNAYERIEYFNSRRKAKIGECMNYSILSGLILSYKKGKQ